MPSVQRAGRGHPYHTLTRPRYHPISCLRVFIVCYYLNDMTIMLSECCAVYVNSPLCVCVCVCAYSHACKAACCMAPMLQSYRDNWTPYVSCLVQYKAVIVSLSERFFTIVPPKKLFPVGIAVLSLLLLASNVSM